MTIIEEMAKVGYERMFNLSWDGLSPTGKDLWCEIAQKMSEKFMELCDDPPIILG